MKVKLDNGITTLIIFILAATLLSAAQSVVTTGLADVMMILQFHLLLHNGFIHHFYLFLVL